MVESCDLGTSVGNPFHIRVIHKHIFSSYPVTILMAKAIEATLTLFLKSFSQPMNTLKHINCLFNASIQLVVC